MQPYELTVRKHDKWGLAVVPVRPKWPGGEDPADKGHRQLTFFVHGFNNVLASAEHVWRNHTWPELIEKCSNLQHRKEVALIYWPGDVSANRLVSGALYPLQIQTARRAADELVAYLARLKGPVGQKIRLRFVAHSLGCRVVLETLRRIEKFGLRNLEVEHVLLMAAAVPIGYCEAGERFGSKVASGREEVLFSTRDWVLKFFFMPGQTLALDVPAAGRTAVGRSGKPAQRWKPSHDDMKLGHGKYWVDSKSIRHIAGLICEDPQDRSPPTRKQASRDVSDSWELDEREISSRAS